MMQTASCRVRCRCADSAAGAQASSTSSSSASSDQQRHMAFAQERFLQQQQLFLEQKHQDSQDATSPRANFSPRKRSPLPRAAAALPVRSPSKGRAERDNSEREHSLLSKRTTGTVLMAHAVHQYARLPASRVSE